MTLNQQNQRLFAKLALVAAAMFGFGYLLVPFYYQICAAWGVNSLGEVRDAPVNTQVDTARVITVEFDANAHGLPWRFKPLVNHIQVGEGATDFFDKPTRDFPQIKVVLDDDQKFHCRQIGVPISPPRARSYTKEIPDKDLCAPPCPW